MGRLPIDKEEKVIPITIHVKRSSIKKVGGSNDFKKAQSATKKRLTRAFENMLHEAEHR